MTIYFNEKEAFEQLTKQDVWCVVTLRERGKYKIKPNGIHLVFSKFVPHPHVVGKAYVEMLRFIEPSKDKDILKTYFVFLSGFDSVEDWLSRLKNPHKTHYLYKVKLIYYEEIGNEVTKFSHMPHVRAIPIKWHAKQIEFRTKKP